MFFSLDKIKWKSFRRKKILHIIDERNDFEFYGWLWNFEKAINKNARWAQTTFPPQCHWIRCNKVIIHCHHIYRDLWSLFIHQSCSSDNGLRKRKNPSCVKTVRNKTHRAKKNQQQRMDGTEAKQNFFNGNQFTMFSTFVYIPFNANSTTKNNVYGLKLFEWCNRQINNIAGKFGRI